MGKILQTDVRGNEFAVQIASGADVVAFFIIASSLFCCAGSAGPTRNTTAAGASGV